MAYVPNVWRTLILAKPTSEAAIRLLAGLVPENSDEPDVVILAARAQLALTVLDAAGEPAARRLLERLAGLGRQEDGGYGWGLSFAWDAFQDGVVNPVDTIYSYTTASAALAFLDGYERLHDKTYLEIATAAGETLTKLAHYSDNGIHASIWYSNQLNDHQEGREVHNVSGLTLAVLQSLVASGVTVDLALAEKIARHLVDVQGVGIETPDHAATSGWVYMTGASNANDLLHETFIIDGLRRHSIGLDAAEVALKGIVESHFWNGWWRPEPHTLGSRNWGPAGALEVLTGHPIHGPLAVVLAQRMVDVINGDGPVAIKPPEHERARAWYAMALARHAAHP